MISGVIVSKTPMFVARWREKKKSTKNPLFSSLFFLKEKNDKKMFQVLSTILIATLLGWCVGATSPSCNCPFVNDMCAFNCTGKDIECCGMYSMAAQCINVTEQHCCRWWESAIACAFDEDCCGMGGTGASSYAYCCKAGSTCCASSEDGMSNCCLPNQICCGGRHTFNPLNNAFCCDAATEECDFPNGGCAPKKPPLPPPPPDPKPGELLWRTNINNFLAAPMDKYNDTFTIAFLVSNVVLIDTATGAVYPVLDFSTLLLPYHIQCVQNKTSPETVREIYYQPTHYNGIASGVLFVQLFPTIQILANITFPIVKNEIGLVTPLCDYSTFWPATKLLFAFGVSEGEQTEYSILVVSSSSLAVEWSALLNGTEFVDAATTGEYLWFLASNSTLFALDVPTGKVVIEFDFPHDEFKNSLRLVALRSPSAKQNEVSMFVQNGSEYYTPAGGFGISSTDSGKSWATTWSSTNLGFPLYVVPETVGTYRIILSSTSGDAIHSVDPDTGTVTWTLPLPLHLEWNSFEYLDYFFPVAVDLLLVVNPFGFSGAAVFNQTSGEMAWSLPSDVSASSRPLVVQSLHLTSMRVLYMGTVRVQENSFALTAFDATTGTILQEWNMSAQVAATPCSLDGGKIVSFGDWDTNLYAIAAL